MLYTQDPQGKREKSKALNLAHQLSFVDLHTVGGLESLDRAFRAFLFEADADLSGRYEMARERINADSALLIDLAPHVEAFLADLFGIQAEVLALQQGHHHLAPMFTIKRLFVQRLAVKKYPEAKDFDGEAIRKELVQKIDPWTDLNFAQTVAVWLRDESKHAEVLDLAARYAAWACYHIHDSVLFHIPKRIDPENLVDFQSVHRRYRQGFQLTDSGFSREQSLGQANYCIWCHHQGKDSCAKGLKENLSGCPLDQKISEMNELKAKGFSLGALAVVMIDNPLVAATGHRICNDCMKACIYQKQEPVNIPGVETQILKEILELPWGVEIYALLTRWNPLNVASPLPQQSLGYKVLVAGMGPAGFTLAHYLLNQGHQVVGIDGLKIEPFPETLKKEPVYALEELWEPLDQRVNWGFGGVAEYGITVRWDKNFLKLIRLVLERRENFILFDGVRFGGTLTATQAFELGFDHVALCLGTGQPKLIPLKNSLAKGVRQASDFLMALQLTGAAKLDSIANLQVRLPIVVIGGGLTAIDTATEALAYYPIQVEKFLGRYESVGAEWQNAEDQSIAEEFLAHARALQGASPERRAELLQEWGGATIVYRRDFHQAPSYRLNPEEVEKALEEGIQILDHATPKEVILDDYGAAKALHLQEKIIPAKTVLIAVGTTPQADLPHQNNISYWGDLDPAYAGNVVKAMASAKKGAPGLDQLLRRSQPKPTPGLFSKLEDGLRAHVVRVERLTPTIVEVIVRAPFAASAFHPGQFYRLQNYETIGGMAMEGLALTGAAVNGNEISLIVLEMGGSSRLCAALQPEEPVVLMGPTGTATEIPKNEKVLLIGGGLGNAVLFSIGKAMRANGNHVTYFAGYRKCEDRFKVADIEAAADQVIWCCEEAPGFQPSRPQDLSFQGNIIEALQAHTEKIKDIQRLMVIGSDRLMAAVAQATQEYNFKAVASINSPMQCMMKGICAQCLQRHYDPVTGQESVVFSCINQDQNLKTVDFNCLHDRLAQNHVQEQLTDRWIRQRPSI